MNRFSQIILLTALLGLSSCAAIFLPRNQKVTIRTNNKESKVYIDKEEVGKGSTVVTKVRKSGAKQVVVQTPGYKDAYYTLIPIRRPNAYWVCIVLDIPTIYGCSFDPIIPKSKNYASDNLMPSTYKYINRTPDQRYIDLSAIKLNITNKNKDLNDYYVNYSENQMEEFKNAEKKRVESVKKEEARKQKKKKNTNMLAEENEIKYDDTQFSVDIYKTLKKTGFVDTVNTLFSDNSNTLRIEGSIHKASVFHVSGLDYYAGRYEKARLDIIWKVKNNFDEVLDSVSLQSFSGDYNIPDYTADDKMVQRMFADAVDNSYSDLLKNEKFKNYLRIDTVMTISDPLLAISQPKSVVKEVSDAAAASVIIKRKSGGHGSGFAITNDGYILTNFHVIAGDKTTQLEDIKVLLSSGEELTAKVVRFNRMRDVALLKVDHNFDKAFKLGKEKSYKQLMEVYTIGAPKSIELGQSVSIGLISNERNFNKTTLLQLSMSINPGNSGGPLFDKSGALQGIVSSKLVGYATEGVGFAIPSFKIANYLNLSVK
ncbi:MAG TPA: trypsin-like peptidase domain-containing protein [Bacteroidales bacterium]|nr:trypsin-like peptidase domain-containing protein [Bacteroidales bacterium]